MFEKEAEKYASNLELIYKKGVLDGYNKANEWHFVKDGDLPKVGQKCYLLYSNLYGEDNKVIFSESSIEVLTGVYKKSARKMSPFRVAYELP